MPELRMPPDSRGPGHPAIITLEDVRAAAEADDMGVAESLVMRLETAEEDRRQHEGEYEAGGRSILRAGHGRPQ